MTANPEAKFPNKIRGTIRLKHFHVELDLTETNSVTACALLLITDFNILDVLQHIV